MTTSTACPDLASAARDLYDAEVALHVAHQTRDDAWITAASDRLHDAVVRYQAAARVTLL